MWWRKGIHLKQGLEIKAFREQPAHVRFFRCRPEKAEDARTRTAHGSVCRSLTVQPCLDICDFGMEGKDPFFEIVRQEAFPFLYGAADDVCYRYSGLSGDDSGVGFLRGHEDTGLHQNEVPSGEGKADGSEDIADACGKYRTVAYEERAVGSQAGHAFFEFVVGQAEVEHLVEAFHHASCVGRASAQTCARRDLLMQRYGKVGKGMVSLYQAQSLDEQVLFRRAVDADAAPPECIIFRGVFLHGDAVGKDTFRAAVRVAGSFELQSVAQWDGVEHGFQVMVTVGTAFRDVQS